MVKIRQRWVEIELTLRSLELELEFADFGVSVRCIIDLQFILDKMSRA